MIRARCSARMSGNVCPVTRPLQGNKLAASHTDRRLYTPRHMATRHISHSNDAHKKTMTIDLSYVDLGLSSSICYAFSRRPEVSFCTEQGNYSSSSRSAIFYLSARLHRNKRLVMQQKPTRRPENRRKWHGWRACSSNRRQKAPITGVKTDNKAALARAANVIIRIFCSPQIKHCGHNNCFQLEPHKKTPTNHSIRRSKSQMWNWASLYFATIPRRSRLR